MGKPNIYQKMRRNGFSSQQIAYMKGIAQQASREMEQDATERAFLYMLTIPLNVLADRGLITHDNAADYIQDVASLYLSVQDGVVTEKDLADLLKEYAGVEITADWMDRITGKEVKTE
jgi:hypothetical protein